MIYRIGKSALVVLALSLFAVLPLMASGSKESSQPNAQKQINLQIGWWGSQSRDKRTIEVLKMYEKVHPNVHFTYQFAGYNDYWTKLTTQAAGNSLPDIIQQDQDGGYLAQWESQGLLTNLDPYVKSGVLDLTNVDKSYLNGGYWNGHLYAIDLGANSMSWVLDTDAFKRAGVPLPPAHWTWKQFEQTARELHQKLGIWGMGSGLLDVSDMWVSTYVAYGKTIYSPDGKSLGYTDDTPLINYLQMCVDLQKAGAIPQESYIVTMQNKGVEQRGIVDKKAAMDLIWSNQIVALWNAAGKDRHFKLALLPRPEGQKSENFVQPSQFFAVTSQSKDPQAAAAFVSYFTNSVDANKVLLGERGVPISSVVRKALEPLLSPGGKASFEFLSFVAQPGNGSPMPPPYPPKFTNIINNVLTPLVVQPVMFGKITPTEGVQLLRKHASAILSGQS